MELATAEDIIKWGNSYCKQHDHFNQITRMRSFAVKKKNCAICWSWLEKEVLRRSNATDKIMKGV